MKLLPLSMLAFGACGPSIPAAWDDLHLPTANLARAAALSDDDEGARRVELTYDFKDSTGAADSAALMQHARQLARLEVEAYQQTLQQAGYTTVCVTTDAGDWNPPDERFPYTYARLLLAGAGGNVRADVRSVPVEGSGFSVVVTLVHAEAERAEPWRHICDGGRVHIGKWRKNECSCDVAAP